MTASDFHALLEKIAAELMELQSGKRGTFVLPKEADTQSFDLGQHEVWKRLLEYDHSTYVHVPDHGYDQTCEACQDLYAQGIVASTQLMRNYLEGRLTDPREVMHVQYLNKDGSHSVGCAYYLENGRPMLRCNSHVIQQGLQHYFDDFHERYANVDEVQLPQYIKNYALEDERIKCVFFQEEL